MGDIACLSIDESTRESFEAFVHRIRDEWGEKLYDDFDVRVLPNVKDNCINSFQIVNREGGQPVHLIFQQNNTYFIAWGTDPNEMIIFDNEHAKFAVKTEQIKDCEARVDKRSKGRLNKRREREVVEVEPRPTYRSNSGVDYDLARAVKCGFGSEYGSLEKKGASRGSVNVGREALMAAYYEFRKKFVPPKEAQHPNYIERIASSSVLIIYTFPESFRNDRVLRPLLERYDSGGTMPLYVTRLTNDWGKYSKNAHVLMPKSPKISGRHKKLCRVLGLILKKEEEGDKV